MLTKAMHKLGLDFTCSMQSIIQAHSVLVFLKLKIFRVSGTQIEGDSKVLQRKLYFAISFFPVLPISLLLYFDLVINQRELLTVNFMVMIPDLAHNHRLRVKRGLSK